MLMKYVKKVLIVNMFNVSKQNYKNNKQINMRVINDIYQYNNFYFYYIFNSYTKIM